MASLQFPTDSTPLRIESLSLKAFPNKIEFSNRVIPYESIENIIYRSYTLKVNFIAVEREMTFAINTNLNEKPSEFILTSKNPKNLKETNLDSNTFEKLEFVYKIISQATFKHRLYKYLDNIERESCFKYIGYKFMNNGDIIKDNVVVANLIESFNNRLISYGTSWNTHSYKSTDSYELKIYSDGLKVKFFGIESGIKLSIPVVFDQDVFDVIVLYIIKNKRLPSIKDI